jgi:hypothetical protein
LFKKEDYLDSMIMVYLFFFPHLGGLRNNKPAFKAEHNHLLKGLIELWPKFSKYTAREFMIASEAIKAEPLNQKNIPGWILTYMRNSKRNYVKELPPPDMSEEDRKSVSMMINGVIDKLNSKSNQ